MKKIAIRNITNDFSSDCHKSKRKLRLIEANGEKKL